MKVVCNPFTTVPCACGTCRLISWLVAFPMFVRVALTCCMPLAVVKGLMC